MFPERAALCYRTRSRAGRRFTPPVGIGAKLHVGDEPAEAAIGDPGDDDEPDDVSSCQDSGSSSEASAESDANEEDSNIGDDVAHPGPPALVSAADLEDAAIEEMLGTVGM